MVKCIFEATVYTLTCLAKATGLIMFYFKSEDDDSKTKYLLRPCLANFNLFREDFNMLTDVYSHVLSIHSVYCLCCFVVQTASFRFSLSAHVYPSSWDMVLIVILLSLL